MDVSIVIRTYNEQRHLPELLSSIQEQKTDLSYEIVIVDSGSTDGTLDIAKSFHCVIQRISKAEFTFGRSLNIGCRAARGEILVFISGHCVPCECDWLSRLVEPVGSGLAEYSYGRQVGRNGTKFSELQVFSKYFPDFSRVPQDGFYCNNANASLSRAAWQTFGFDESLTGLEDLKMAKSIAGSGGAIAYVAEAPVFHIHDETWHQVRIRYEREALALREIMPEVHVGFFDFVRYFVGGVAHDFGVAWQEKVLARHAFGIVAFRWMQFWGTYRGNMEHRQLSARQKEEFFYPKPRRRRDRGASACGASTYEGSQ